MKRFNGALCAATLSALCLTTTAWGDSVGTQTHSDDTPSFNLNIPGLPEQPDQIRTAPAELKVTGGWYTRPGTSASGVTLGLGGHLDLTVDRSDGKSEFSGTVANYSAQVFNALYKHCDEVRDEQRKKYHDSGNKDENLLDNALFAHDGYGSTGPQPGCFAYLQRAGTTAERELLAAYHIGNDGSLAPVFTGKSSVSLVSMNIVPQGSVDLNLSNTNGKQGLDRASFDLFKTDFFRFNNRAYNVVKGEDGVYSARPLPWNTADFSLLTTGLALNRNNVVGTKETGVILSALNFSVHDVSPKGPEWCLHAEPLRFVVGETQIQNASSAATYHLKAGMCFGVSFGNKAFKIVANGDLDYAGMLSSNQTGSSVPQALTVSDSVTIKDIAGKPWANVTVGHAYDWSNDTLGSAWNHSHRMGVTYTLPIQ